MITQPQRTLLAPYRIHAAQRSETIEAKGDGALIYRLELPADLIEPLAQEAERNERTL